MKTADLVAALDLSPEAADAWIGPILQTFEQFEINTPLRQAAFLAQVGHESDSFTVLEENMNYSAKGLLAVWPRRFDVAKAQVFARQPEKIANEVYACRMGNGAPETGDGWRYRGRGILQLTGKNDYRDCGEALWLDLLNCPELLKTPKVAALSAGWEWNRGKLNKLADDQDFERITRVINGGLNGEEHRLALYQICKHALGVA